MSDSEDDAHLGLPPPHKKRKFAFKKLAQRIAEVDVDVYRQLKTVRAEPLPGCTSFFQEELQKWRELNTAEHFLAASAQLQPITESLPQLLHHKDEIVDILLSNISMEAKLSAPALLQLLGTLARDLQEEYMPYVARVFTHVTNLVHQGAMSEPEMLRPAFECLALICNHLVRRLAADLPMALRVSMRLRCHHAAHVRRLTAATLAYLLRQATTVQLRVCMRSALAEYVVSPTEERRDGLGLLFAEAAKGVSNGLNSKADQLLQLLLHKQLVSAAELNAKSKGKRAVDDAAVQERVHQIAESTLGHLLEHVRRGKVGSLWDAVLELVDQDVIGADPSQATELVQAARATGLVAQMAESYRGSRVESYTPLFELAAHLCKPETLQAAAKAETEALPASLLQQTLRLLTAILAGHSKEVGASEGLVAIEAHASEWGPVFGNLPGRMLVDFLGRLLQPPSGSAAVAGIFAPYALEALASKLVNPKQEAALTDRALAILLAYCRAASDQVELSAEEAFLERCPSGKRLCAHLMSLLKGNGVGREEAANSIAFCALGCLPYACRSASEVATHCDGVLKRAEAGLAKAGNKEGAPLTLLAAALKLKASVLLSAAEQQPEGPESRQLAAMGAVALRWLKAYPSVYTVVEAAASVLAAAQKSGESTSQLSWAALQAMVPVLEGNLISRSQPLRRETLRVLAAFEQPPAGGKEGQGGSACDVLPRLLKIEAAPIAVDSGRPAAVSLEQLKAALEFNHVPDFLIAPLVSSLLGLLNIRLSLLWAPTNDALAAALEHHPSIAGQRIFGYLRAVQADFLSGKGDAIVPDESVEDEELSGETTLRAMQRASEAGSPQRGSGATDASVRLNHLLKSIAKAPSAVLERFASDWVPLFLAHSAAKSTAVDSEANAQEAGADVEAEARSGETGVTVLSRIGSRAWRAHLKDWLAVVSAVKGPKSLQQSEQLRISVAALLMDSDPGVQQAALKCLKAWKLKYLNEHLDRLLRLASNETLREELTAFPLAVSSEDGILEQHRQGLIKVLTRVLWPKMRKRSGRLGGRGAPGSARAAVLNFLAAAQAHELATLLLMVLQPISAAFEPPPAAAAMAATMDADRLFEEPWWTRHLGREQISFWLGVIQPQQLAGFQLRVKQGVLHALADLLQHLGHNMQPFLPEISVLLLALLETTQAGGAEGSGEGSREIRAGSLRLLASLWSRFPAAIDFNALWPGFFSLLQPIMDRMPAEASADRAPPLLEVAAAFAASPSLLPLLADRPSRQDQGATATEELPHLLGGPCEEPWACNASGSRLLGQVVAVLAAPTCGGAAREVGLTLLEDLLGFGDEVAAALLACHMRPLLEALRSIAVVAFEAPAPAKRPRAGKQGQLGQGSGYGKASVRALAILERLSALPCSQTLCEPLADALLPLLKRKSGKRHAGREGLLARVLNVLTVVWERQASNGSLEDKNEARLLGVADSMAALAGEIEGQRAAAALASAFQSLGGLVPSLHPATSTLADLLAYSTTEVDAVDYDRRLAAYRRLSGGGWRESIAGGGALALVHRAFVDLRAGEELALRHASAQALAALVQEVEPATGVLRAVQANLRKGVAAANLAVRQEHLTLLRGIGLRFPEQQPDLRALADVDIEVDFFANVAHLQMHRRIRAMQRLVKLLEQGKLGASVLLSVATPLLAQMVIEGRASEDAGHELKDLDRDREANVADAAVGVLGKVAASLAWPQYRQLLGQFLRNLQRNADSKAVVRAVCAIIDAFHFSTPSEAQATCDTVEPQQAAEGGEEASEGEEEPEAAGPLPAEAEQEEILRSLTKRVLPALEAALVVERGKSVRAPVALAIVKLLLRLPASVARAVLPRVLQGVANLLKHRLQRIRDESRNVLAAMAAELGPQYLPFQLDVLESALPEKGYMGHVKGYTLHFILEALNKRGVEPGAFDEVLPRVLEVVERQLFGDISEERDAGAFGAVREAKRSRANDTYQLTAQNITFRTQLVPLLEPVRCRLAEAAAPGIRAKLAALLESAQRGVAANASAAPQDVLVFVSGVLQTVVQEEQDAIRLAEAAAAAASNGEAVDPEQLEAGAAKRHHHLLLQFALGLLLRGLKKGSLSGRTPEMAAMLDPLLPHLAAALRSRHATVLELALRILSHLVQLPLPGLADAAPEAGDAMTDLMRKAPSAVGRVPQECLRLMASFLRVCPEWAPSKGQLRFLVTWAFTDIEAAAAAVGGFTLIRSIIKRRLLLPEVYDVMSRVQDLMIKSQAAPVRQLCSSTLLQFLLDYPLGAKRFQQHLHFLVANLAFEHESGRLAALDLLAVLASKLPRDMLAANATVIFVPLVARLPADPSPRCRKEVAAALQSLIKLVPAEQVKAFLGFCAEWLAGSDSRLRAAAAQTYGLIAEVQGEAFGRSIRPQLPRLTAILSSHAAEPHAAEALEAGEEEAPPEHQAWQEAYHVLVLLTKLMRSCPALLRWRDSGPAQELWRVLPGLLLHRHLWIRKLSADLLGLAFADAAVWQGLLRDPATSPNRLAALLYLQLEASEAREAYLAQSAKCLIFLAPHLRDADVAAAASQPDRPASPTADEDSGDEDSPEAVNTAAAHTQLQQLSLAGLVRRMAKLADDRSYPRRLARLTALRFLAALVSRLGPQDSQPLLSLLLRPLFRINEGLSPNPPEVKELAQEVLGHVRQVAGAEALATALNEARQSITSARAERRRQQKVKALIDPGASARSKLQKQTRKASGKKRKMEEMARLRGAGLMTKNKRSRKHSEF